MFANCKHSNSLVQFIVTKKMTPSLFRVSKQLTILSNYTMPRIFLSQGNMQDTRPLGARTFYAFYHPPSVPRTGQHTDKNITRLTGLYQHVYNFLNPFLL